MMSGTHIAAGAAAALALAQAGSAESCLAALVGGSVGGVIADCDVRSSRAHRDALMGRLLAAALAVAVLAADLACGAGLAESVASRLGAQTAGGAALAAALTFAGARSAHRSLTHSLAFMAAFCAAVWLAAPALLPYFAAGYASHLALDLLNKRGMRLLWPAPAKIALGLCKADGAANAALMACFTAAAALLLAIRLGAVVPAA